MDFALGAIFGAVVALGGIIAAGAVSRPVLRATDAARKLTATKPKVVEGHDETQEFIDRHFEVTKEL